MAQSFFLADDDDDDRLLFEDALRELSTETSLTVATDGVDLMEKLEETVPPPPSVIFLDINMPRKNGFECLTEMKQIEKFRDIPVVIFSTSNEDSTIDRTYRQGANFYIHKPRSFEKLKSAIQQVMAIDWSRQPLQRSKEKYVLHF
jgi:CheY-like chemotaxis protein